jgi:hypothetical protein
LHLGLRDLEKKIYGREENIWERRNKVALVRKK